MNKQNVVIFACIVFGYTVSNARISSHEAGKLRGQYTAATESQQKEILNTLRSSNYANIADQLELVSSRKEIADQTASLAQQESALAQQQTQINQLNQQTQKLTQEKTQLQQEKTQLQQKELAQQTQLKNQEDLLKSQKATLEQRSNELKQAQSSLAQKEKNVAELNSQIKTLTDATSTHEKEKESLAQELKALRAQKDTTDKELLTLKGGDSGQIKRIKELEGIIKDKEHELQTNKQSSDTCSKSLTAANKEILELKKGNERIAQLEREKQELRTQTEQLKKNAAAAQQEISDLQKHSPRIAQLENENLGLKEHIDALKKNVEDTQKSTAPVQAQIEKLKEQLAQKESECDKKSTQANTEHQKIVAELTVKTTDLERQLKTREQEAAIAKESEQGAITTRNNCMAREQEQDKKIQALNQQIADLQKESKDLQTQLANQKATHDAALAALKDAYLKEEQEHTREMQDAIDSYNELQQENEQLKTKNQTLINEFGGAGLVNM